MLTCNGSWLSMLTCNGSLQALQAQIAGDFKHVTSFGNKAGYMPPVKVPHV